MAKTTESTATAPTPAVASERPGSQIRVEFRTSHPDISLPPDTGPVLVPTSLRRYGLSTLVNHLLSTPSPTPFDFLVSGTFLRTSIDDYLSAHGLSSETTLTLEYVRSVIPPSYLSSFQHSDWVSCVDILSSSSFPDSKIKKGEERILSGSYDGLLRIWDTSSQLLATSTLSPAPSTSDACASVKTALFLSPTTIVSAGFDRTVTVHTYHSSPSSTTLTPSLTLKAHTLPISSLAYHCPSQHLLSAAHDTTVALFSLSPSSLPSTLLPSSTSTNSSVSKRRKLSSSSRLPPAHSPLITLRGATGPSTSALFHPSDSSVAYSSSLDHTVRTWDLTTSALVDTRTLSHPLMCMTSLSSLNLLVAGTTARHLSLVDPRVEVKTASVMTLRGHRNAVSCVTTEAGASTEAGAPGGYGVVSGSWDGQVRGWDVRFVKDGGVGSEGGGVGESVWVVDHNLAKEQAGGATKARGETVFGVAWDSAVGVVSAGQDKRVAIHRSPEVAVAKSAE